MLSVSDQRGADVRQPIQQTPKQFVQAFGCFGKVEFHEIARLACGASEGLHRPARGGRSPVSPDHNLSSLARRLPVLNLGTPVHELTPGCTTGIGGGEQGRLKDLVRFR